jgi:DNA-binding CsgD family transcriptional regulator
VYGFFGAIVYILHDIGFLGGMAAESVRVLGVSTTGLVALVSIYLLAFIYFLGAGGGFGNKDKRLADIEFIALNGQGRKTGEGPRLHRKKLDTPEEILPCGAVARTCESCASSALHAAEESGNAGANSTHSYMSIDLTAEENENIQKGKFKRKIEILQQDYGLTAREAEIMELIVRGNTVARIADILVISENTVRTHSKRLYTKLDVHKKQEIVDLLDGIYVE